MNCIIIVAFKCLWLTGEIPQTNQGGNARIGQKWAVNGLKSTHPLRLVWTGTRRLATEYPGVEKLPDYLRSDTSDVKNPLCLVIICLATVIFEK